MSVSQMLRSYYRLFVHNVNTGGAVVAQPPGDIDPETLRRMPYQKPQPVEMLPDLVVPNAIPTDERIWVPQSENVWFRPLCLNRSAGYWMNLLKVRKSGVLSRHRHPGPVHAL